LFKICFLLVFCFACAIVILIFFVIFLISFLVLFLLIDLTINNNNSLLNKKVDSFLLKVFVCKRFSKKLKNSFFVLLLYLSTILTTIFSCLFLIYCVKILFIFFYFFVLFINILTTFLELFDLTIIKQLCKIMLQTSIFLLSFSIQSTFL